MSSSPSPPSSSPSSPQPSSPPLYGGAAAHELNSHDQSSLKRKKQQQQEESPSGLELKTVVNIPRNNSKVCLSIDQQNGEEEGEVEKGGEKGSPATRDCNSLSQSVSTTSEDSGVGEYLGGGNLQSQLSVSDIVKKVKRNANGGDDDDIEKDKDSKANDDDDDNGKGGKGDEPDLIETVMGSLSGAFRRYRVWFYLACLVGYNVFFGFAVHRTWHRTTTYCSGVKLLALLTAATYAVLLYRLLFKPYIFRLISGLLKSSDLLPKLSAGHRLRLKVATWLVVLAALVAFIVYNAWNEWTRLYSGAGYLGFILLGFIFSKHRRAIQWNQILWGLTMQLVFGIIVLRTALGKTVFSCIGEKINAFLGFTTAGTDLVFGYLSTGRLAPPTGNVTLDLGNGSLTVGSLDLTMPVQSTIFAFSAMPVVIFFSFFISILYFYGIMQAVVKQLGWVLQVTIGTTACESISASGNIFLGMTESPLLVKPFLPIMTKSELHAVLTGGFATIAGSVMAAYISFGISASHLLSASVMAAPSALALSKLLYPEVEVSKTTAGDIQLEKGSERNAIEAGSNGASTAVKLVANIMANLIAFMAFLAFLDAVLAWIGDMVDIPELSFKLIMSKLFIPLALMLGIEWADCEKIASLIGLKMVINEFVAYQELSTIISSGTISKRSETIATFALCSFANISSIGIQVGGLSSMAPSRKSDLAQLAVRAMITGSMASFMTACVAGMLS